MNPSSYPPGTVFTVQEIKYMHLQDQYEHNIQLQEHYGNNLLSHDVQVLDDVITVNPGDCIVGLANDIMVEPVDYNHTVEYNKEDFHEHSNYQENGDFQEYGDYHEYGNNQDYGDYGYDDGTEDYFYWDYQDGRY